MRRYAANVPKSAAASGADERADEQGAVDRVGELLAQRSRATLGRSAHAAHPRHPHALVEDRGGELPHDDVGRDRAQHGDEQVRHDEPDVEAVHDGPPTGSRRNL